MRQHLIHMGLIMVLSTCIEPFEFDVTDTDPVLVVDAVFTNESKAHQVKLSSSGPLGDDDILTVTGASVWIVGGGGIRIDFTETSPGVYETASTAQGVVGQSYTFFIRLQDGTEYASTEELLPAPIAIDSIYGRYLEVPSTENDQILQGVQFFIDTHDDKSEFSNFRYEYEEDFEVIVPYPSMYEWNTTTETFAFRSIDVSKCYGHYESVELLVATTNGQSQNRLAEFPIRRVNRDDGQLSSKYALVVKQFVINSAAYQYYKSLKENNESSGSFFDKQKGTVPGNIKNLTEVGAPVLGYFELSGVSRSTAFFVPGQFIKEGFKPTNPLRSSCVYKNQVDSVNTALLSNSVITGKNIITVTFPQADTAVLISKSCSDCRLHGEIKRPDYWE